jgi:arylsulfatase A-like enzyme
MPITDPAHVSILTGLQPRTHGVRSNGIALPHPVPNIAGWLAGLGYHTGAFVSRAHVVPTALGIDGFEIENGPTHHSRPATPTCENAWAWVDAVADEPFFLWLHLFDPHHPYEAPPETERRFLAADAPPPIEPDYKSLSLSPIQSSPRYEAEAVDAMIARYDAEIAFADSALRRFLGRLEDRLGPSRSPLVMLTADHGEALDELEERFRFSFGHGFFLHQGLVRVPLILRWKGQLPEGRMVPGPVQLVDLVPTLFELLHVDGFPNQGRSLVRLLDAGEPMGGSKYAETAPRYAYSERQQFIDGTGRLFDAGQQYAVQDDRYKLILTLPAGETELYDLVSDPKEEQDRSTDLPEIRRRLLDALDGYLGLPIDENEFSSLPEDRLEALRALGYIQ